jgi:hypothetical protein
MELALRSPSPDIALISPAAARASTRAQRWLDPEIQTQRPNPEMTECWSSLQHPSPQLCVSACKYKTHVLPLLWVFPELRRLLRLALAR